jgi:two-component system response regulator PilR (NtrC family)
LDDLERRHLLAALDQAGGVKTKAADLLGLSFRSFRYRLAKQGLSERDELDSKQLATNNHS